jgi:hypothetical protein
MTDSLNPEIATRIGAKKVLREIPCVKDAEPYMTVTGGHGNHFHRPAVSIRCCALRADEYAMGFPRERLLSPEIFMSATEMK